MAKKILLAAGCSYTDKTFFSQDDSLSDSERGGWQMWPEIMSENLDLECVNVGQSGAGNDHIFNQLVHHLSVHRDNIDTIAILWSGADRQNFFTWRLNAPVELSIFLEENSNRLPAFSWLEEIGIGKVNANYWTSKRFDRETYRWLIDNYVYKLSAIIKLAESYGVKLIMMQGVAPLDFWTYRRLYENKKIITSVSDAQASKYFITNPATYELNENKKNIIGWPIFESLGGFCVDYLIKPDNRVSKIDGHPNAAGQEVIGDLFFKKYNELYG